MLSLLYRPTDDGVFDDFPKISDYFSNISEDSKNLPEENISEDFRRLSRKTRGCFDHTPTNLNPGTISDTNLISVQSSISSLGEDMENTPPEWFV